MTGFREVSRRTVTARKVHPCMTCRAPAVQPGEPYERVVYVYDGSAYAWVQCFACRQVIEQVRNYADPYFESGVGEGEYLAWAGENPDVPEACRYLERRRNGASLRNANLTAEGLPA